MKNLRKERKVIIEKKDYYSVNLEGDNTYYHPKTKEEAEKLKKKLKQQEKEKVKECNDRELRSIEANKIIRFKIEEEMQNLVTTQRMSKNDERRKMAKELRARLKEIIDSATRRADEKVGFWGLDIN